MTSYNSKDEFKSFGGAQKIAQQLKTIAPYKRNNKKGSRYIEIPIPFIAEHGIIQNEGYCRSLAGKIWDKFKVGAEVTYGFSVNSPKDDFVILIPYPVWSWKTYYKLLIWLELKHLPYRITTDDGTILVKGGILDDN